MSLPVIMLALNVSLMGGLWPFGGEDQAPDESGTIKSLEPADIELKKDTALPAGDTLRAREQYRLFLEVSADHPELRRQAMRRLADLSMDAGEEAQFESGVGDAAFYQEAITLYLTLLDRNSADIDEDRILYQLARAYESTGENDRALEVLDRLIAGYPDSVYFDEAQFRRGEAFFMARQYLAAEQAYQAVVVGGPSSRFYEQALYKQGWSEFKLGEHEASLDSFMDLLDHWLAGSADGADAIEAMPRTQQELVEDTLRVLSITFSYLDGPQSINDLLDRRGSVDYASLLYVGLGDLYVEKERYTDAAQTYAAFVERYPGSDRSPGLQARVIDAYTLGKFPSLVIEAKRDYVDLYGLRSPFWAQRNVADYAQVIADLKQNLGDLASYDHALAQELDDAQAYERAAYWYRAYLDFFPEDPQAARRSFLLAEILFELGRYDQATDQYLNSAYAYGEHENAAEAGYAALLASREHEKTLSGVVRKDWHDRYTDQALNFAERFPAHENAAAVRTVVAEELFSAGELAAAVEVAGLVVTMQPPASPQLEQTAWTVIGHAQFDLGRYADAEQAYRRLRDMPVVDEQALIEIEQRIGASVYKQGEQLQATGDVNAAVDQYLRVAEAAPASDVVPNAMFDAATLLINDGQWQASVEVLQEFRRQFPDHEFSDDVTQKLAVAYRSADQPVLAAAEYELVAVLSGSSEQTRREALWEAATLYRSANRLADEARVYREIVARFPVPMSESIEARQRLADHARSVDDLADRRMWLESIVVADAQAGSERTPRSRTLAARASLEFAKPYRDAFATTALTIPLKDSLRFKKQYMESALQAYGEAADYDIEEVTTAATFEIADLYYRLSQDLLNSQRPAELNAEELEQYEILLEEQAFPFEEQAIDIFDANASRAATGIYDEWVRKSIARLAALMPARYARDERSETIVATLR
jgi:TolA-binding protein